MKPATGSGPTQFITRPLSLVGMTSEPRLILRWINGSNDVVVRDLSSARASASVAKRDLDVRGASGPAHPTHTSKPSASQSVSAMAAAGAGPAGRRGAQQRCGRSKENEPLSAVCRPKEASRKAPSVIGYRQ